MQESFARKLSQLYEQFDGGRCCSFHAKALGYLSTSDHFYYMSTKGGGDGVVHAYFSPYETPYDAFARVMNVVRDLLQLVCVVDNQRSNRL